MSADQKATVINYPNTPLPPAHEVVLHEVSMLYLRTKILWAVRKEWTIDKILKTFLKKFEFRNENETSIIKTYSREMCRL
jgi:hypothetical protein